MDLMDGEHVYMVNKVAIVLELTITLLLMDITSFRICSSNCTSHSNMTSTEKQEGSNQQVAPDGGWGYVCIPAVFVLQVCAGDTFCLSKLATEEYKAQQYFFLFVEIT